MAVRQNRKTTITQPRSIWIDGMDRVVVYLVMHRIRSEFITMSEFRTDCTICTIWRPQENFSIFYVTSACACIARHTFLPQWIQIVRTTQIHTSIAIGPLLTNQLEKIYFRLANIQCNEKLITTADQVANAIYTLFTRCHCCYNKRNVTSQFCPIKSNTHIQWMNWPNYIRAHR